LGPHCLKLGREPRCPRKIDGVDERCFLGVVQTWRLGLHDLALKIVEPDSDELEGIEHEAFVEASAVGCTRCSRCSSVLQAAISSSAVPPDRGFRRPDDPACAR
jgi:hypothetical protein